LTHAVDCSGLISVNNSGIGIFRSSQNITNEISIRQNGEQSKQTHETKVTT